MNTNMHAHLSPAETSIRLNDLKESILQYWEVQALESVSAASKQSRVQLKDSLPDFIEQLVATLLAPSVHLHSQASADIAREHGADRASQTGYSLNEVIFEYHLLRKTLINLLSAERTLSEEARAIIHEYVDRGIRKAAVEYAERQNFRETEAKRQQDETQQQLAEAIEVAKIGFYSWDIAEDRIVFSERMQRDWGIKADSPLQDVIRSVHPDDQARVRYLISKSVETHTPYSTEYRVVRPDNSVIWVEAKGETSYSIEGKPLRFVGTSINITDRILALQKLDESSKLIESSRADLSDTLESMSDAFISVDKNWKITQINDAMLRICGKSKDETIDSDFKYLFFAHETGSQSQTWELLQSVMRDRTPLSFEDFYKPLSVWFQTRSFPKKDGGLAIFFTDITEARKSEQALSIERRKFEIVLTKAPVGIAILSGSPLKFEMVNSTWAGLTSPRANVGQTYADTYPELSKLGIGEIINEVFKSGKTYTVAEMEATVEVSKGVVQKRYFDFSCVQITNSFAQAYGVFGIASDVTDRVIFQRNLKDAKADAERDSSLKSAFLANMSHEIRTPLAAILGYTEILKEPHLPLVERNQYLETISRSGKSLTKIIDDILDLAKVESGKLEIELIDFSLIELINDVVALFSNSVDQKGIYLRTSYSAQLPQLINSDPTRIRQVLINLVGNAVKFTSQGGVTIKVVYSDSDPELKVNQCELKILVVDTGLGIPMNKREKLFTPFSQADSSTTRKHGGTGLGLVLSKRLANALNGDIEIANCEGLTVQGCTFIFTLKAAFVEHSTELYEKKSEFVPLTQSTNFRLSGLNILVADDSKDNQFLVTRILSKEGATVSCASNGEEAVRLAKTNSYSIILMDIQMPGMDGYEATKLIKASDVQTPIIALTAHAMAEERARSFSAGCDGHLTKPIDKDELINCIILRTKPGILN